jgi:hypothetical protein
MGRVNKWKKVTQFRWRNVGRVVSLGVLLAGDTLVGQCQRGNDLQDR